MKINAEGLELVKHFEDCELKAYQDDNDIWTIGYGHTRDVEEGQTCTQEQAEAWLEQDLETAEFTVDRFVKVPITENQFSALASFAFNVGYSRFKNSTLLRLLNDGDYRGAAHELSRWIYAGGFKSNGLIRRREAERQLYLKS